LEDVLCPNTYAPGAIAGFGVQIPVSHRKSLKKPNGAHFEPMVQRPYQHGTVAGVLTRYLRRHPSQGQPHRDSSQERCHPEGLSVEVNCRERESFKLLKRHAFFSSSTQFNFAVKRPSFADSIELRRNCASLGRSLNDGADLMVPLNDIRYEFRGENTWTHFTF